MTKIRIISLLIISVAIIVLVYCVGLTIFLSPITVYGWGVSVFGEKPAKPAIALAEFPFQIEYSINGECFVVSDVYVCEFVGFEVSASTMKNVRSWKGYLKSNPDEETLSILEKQWYDDGIECYLNIYITLGDPKYYMGDPVYSRKDVPSPKFHGHYAENGQTKYLDFEETRKEYGLKIISFEFSAPIQNTFE